VKVLLIGRSGQLATELLKQAPESYELLIPERQEFDLQNGDICRKYIVDHEPDWVLNAGAYTNVDLAETQSSQAYKINSEGPAAIASGLKESGGRLLHVSSDYVFSGDKLKNYEITDDPAPINVYGHSKWLGESNISSILNIDKYAIVRTSWVYSAIGKNFVRTMLRLFQENNVVRVVADQYGCPTSATSLASACWRIIDQSVAGVLHWTDGSAMSWADFADAIAEEAFNIGLLSQRPIILRVGTKDYPTPATRPKCSILNCSDSYERLGVERPYWLMNLRNVLEELVVD
jgi:dTDP-4-dehydrorhamnose reductase